MPRTIIEKSSKLNNKQNKHWLVTWFSKSITGAYALYSLIVAITGFSLFSVLYPRIELIAGSSLNPKEPFQTLIEIKNINPLFAVKNVMPILEIDSMSTLMGSTVLRSKFSFVIIDEIGPNQPETFHFSAAQADGLNEGINYADLAYNVQYTFLGINCVDRFNFRFEKGVNGEIVWQRMNKKEFNWQHPSH